MPMGTRAGRVLECAPAAEMNAEMNTPVGMES